MRLTGAELVILLLKNTRKKRWMTGCLFLTKKVTSRKIELYFIVKQMIKKAINVIRIEKKNKNQKKKH